jgi:hypothetical protein
MSQAEIVEGPGATSRSTGAAPAHTRGRGAGAGGRESLVQKLIVVAAGALVTALAALLVAGPLTRQWQDRQKARDLRAGLVTTMSDAVSQALGTTQSLNHEPASPQRAEQYFAAQIAWRRQRWEVEARLNAYLAGRRAGARWNALAGDVDRAMRLIAAQVQRPELVWSLRRHVRLASSGAANRRLWNDLSLEGRGDCAKPVVARTARPATAPGARTTTAHGIRPPGSPCFAGAYAALVRALDARRDRQIEEVLATPVQGLASGFRSAFSDSL